MSASVSGMRGGQPSTTQPIAAPWLSPKLVNRKRWPKVLKDIGVPLLRSLVARGPAAVKSGVTGHLIALKYVNHALRHIEQRRGGRLGDTQIGHQPACGATVGGRYRVPRQAVVPSRHTRRDHLVAFATAGRHEVPLVVLALRD